MVNKNWFRKVANILNENGRYFTEWELAEYIDIYYDEYLWTKENKKESSVLRDVIELLKDYSELKLANELANAMAF